MRVHKFLSRIRFVVDPDTGVKSAVLINYAIWEELVALLEGIEDAEEDNELHESNDQSPRPFGLCAGEFTVPDDFDDPLPERVIEDFEGRR